MTVLMNEPAENNPASPSTLEAVRREKMAKLVELGIDPWGGRFDDRLPIGEIRARAGEIVYQLEDGKSIALPDFAAAGPDFNFRQWKADQGKGEIVGPTVRAAGRIVLQRDKGKLLFIDIRDWTGQIQLFVGQQQVGDDWELAECFDLGDIIGVDGELRRTKTGELSIFAERLHFLTKSDRDAAGKAPAACTDPELRQRMRYLDLTYTEGVLDAVPQPHEDRPVDPRHARRPRLCRSRRPDAARDRRRRRGPAVQDAPQRARHRPVHCGSRWSCTSSGCWSAASSGSTSWAASIATKASARGTIPSSRCSRSTRPTATTAR